MQDTKKAREENKGLFVRELGNLLTQQTDLRESVQGISYVSELLPNGEERVLIEFCNGHIKEINVTGDSCIAIMHDLYKALR